MADANCDVTYSLEDDCCGVDLGGSVIEPPTEPPQEPPEEPPEDDSGCPYYCGFGSPEGVQESTFEDVDVIGGMYEQLDVDPTSHPWWAKLSVGGNTGWRPWAGLGSEGALSYRLGDGSLADGNRALSLGALTRASGLESDAIGYNSQALADYAKAFGSGAIVSGVAGLGWGKDVNVDSANGIGIGELVDINAVRGIGIGKASRVDAVEGISVGDGRTLSINDISLGWGHNFGVAVAHPNIIIGKHGTILTGADSSSSIVADYGGHILIGEDTETPYAASQFHNTVIGFQAKARGRACIVIGDKAESRAADNPYVGVSEGRFAFIGGYLAKGSGGCIVSIGDQCDVRGDSAIAVGTHARANYNNTAAVGPNAFAGGVSSTEGIGASAYGVSAQALRDFASALGYSAFANAAQSVAIGLSRIEAGHNYSVALAQGQSSSRNQIAIGGDLWNDGTQYALMINFNNNPNPAIMITPGGKIQFVTSQIVTDSTRTFPLTGDATLDADDHTVTVSTTGGARTITLPPVASVPAGHQYYIRRETATANGVTIVPDGTETIDGDPNYTLDVQWEWVLIEKDGTPGNEWTVS